MWKCGLIKRVKHTFSYLCVHQGPAMWLNKWWGVCEYREKSRVVSWFAETDKCWFYLKWVAQQQKIISFHQVWTLSLKRKVPRSLWPDCVSITFVDKAVLREQLNIRYICIFKVSILWLGEARLSGSINDEDFVNKQAECVGLQRLTHLSILNGWDKKKDC